jgi:hypothetical protein
MSTVAAKMILITDRKYIFYIFTNLMNTYRVLGY